MMKMANKPNVDVMLQRERTQRERYEELLYQRNIQIESQLKTIKEQQETIGKLRKELNYKNTLIERLTTYGNVQENTKVGFWKRLFKKGKKSDEEK